MKDWTPYVVGIDMPLQARGEQPAADSGVYFLFAPDGGMTYIGQSLSIGYRLRQHALGRDFSHFGCIAVPDNMLNGVEGAYIEALDPAENRMAVTGMVPAWRAEMVEAIRDRWQLVRRWAPAPTPKEP